MSCSNCCHKGDGSKLPRRRILLLGAVAAGLAACRADADTAYFGFDLPDGEDAQSPVDDTGNPVDDAGNPVDDAGNPVMDSGSAPDVFVRDSGTPPRDSGTVVDAGPTCTPGPGASIGPVTNYPVGTLVNHTVSSMPCIIGHDSGGLYAMTAVCTHQGCTVRASSSGLQCPCHGATYDVNGQNPTYPAPQPLVHFQMTVCAGTAYVNTSRTVSASTRTSPIG